MKVSTRLALGLGVLMALFTAVVTYQLVTIDRTVAVSQQMASVSSRLLLTSTRQDHELSQLEENAAKYAITGDPGYAGRYRAVAREVESTMDSLRSLELRGPEARAVERLDARWRDFRALVPSDSPTARPGSAGDDLPGETVVPAVQVEAVRASVDTLRRLSGQVGQAARSAMLARLRASERRADRAARASLFAAAGALVVGVVVSALLLRAISRSLDRLTEGTQEVARGDLSYRIQADGHDEFARLAEDFNAMTERLEEVDRMKRDFLSMVSHDLKSPLASIQETHHLLLDGLAGELTEKQRHLLQLGVRHGERLSAMISKLLDLSRMDAGEIQFRMEPGDLREALRGALRELGPRVEESGARVEVDLPGRPLRVVHDSEFVRRVLENLLENALRYSPADRPIRVVGRRLEDRPESVPRERWAAAAGSGRPAVLLEVRDEGPGVAESDKERIFERFVRGRRQPDGDGQERRGGVGLGLALCRKVVGSHGGEIWVDDREGGGSVFRILFPAASPEAGSEERTVISSDVAVTAGGGAA